MLLSEAMLFATGIVRKTLMFLQILFRNAMFFVSGCLLKGLFRTALLFAAGLVQEDYAVCCKSC